MRSSLEEERHRGRRQLFTTQQSKHLDMFMGPARPGTASRVVVRREHTTKVSRHTALIHPVSGKWPFISIHAWHYSCNCSLSAPFHTGQSFFFFLFDEIVFNSEHFAPFSFCQGAGYRVRRAFETKRAPLRRRNIPFVATVRP